MKSHAINIKGNPSMEKKLDISAARKIINIY
jgi:hypothetical protein